MYHRYELYDENGEYAGVGFMTSLRISGISNDRISRLMREFRKLPFPIIEDKQEKSTSLFTYAGNDEFVFSIKRLQEAYEAQGVYRLHHDVVDENTFADDDILYADEYQVIVRASAYDEKVRSRRK